MKNNLMVAAVAAASLATAPGVMAQSPEGAAPPQPTLVEAHSFSYARIGYGPLFGEQPYGMPGFGFGYRAALNRLGLDVSFLNLQTYTDSTYTSNGRTAGSWVKLEALRYSRPGAKASLYVGGGVSLGGVDFGDDSGRRLPDGATEYQSPWSGHGLQSELTLGYELARDSTMRVFLQADATLPLYSARSVTSVYSRATGTEIIRSDSRYAPSLVLSVGMGWGRGRR